MSRCAVLYVLTSLLWLGAGVVLGQSKKEPKPITDYIPTENLDPRKEANISKNKPKRKVIEYIYVNNTEKAHYGNPCVVEATRKMGFEYVINPFWLPGSVHPDDQFANNLRVHMKLIFTRSPFWKIKLNRRIKKCREISGDIVG